MSNLQVLKNFLMGGGKIFLGNGTVSFLSSDNSENTVGPCWESLLHLMLLRGHLD